MKTFEELGTKIGRLVASKNLAYGNAAIGSAEMLKVAYPNGIQPHQYRDALLIIRIFDKILRAANNKMAFGESPFEDIAGYGILGWKADLDEFDGKGGVGQPELDTTTTSTTCGLRYANDSRDGFTKAQR